MREELPRPSGPPVVRGPGGPLLATMSGVVHPPASSRELVPVAEGRLLALPEGEIGAMQGVSYEHEANPGMSRMEHLLMTMVAQNQSLHREIHDLKARVEQTEAERASERLRREMSGPRAPSVQSIPVPKVGMGAPDGHTAGGMVREMLREATMGPTTSGIPSMASAFGQEATMRPTISGTPPMASSLGGVTRGLSREAQAGPPPVRAAWTAAGVGPGHFGALIGVQALQGIEQIAQQSQHGLALATQVIFQLRRTIHEKEGLNQVPPAHPEPNSPPVIRAICEQIAGAVVASLATETILHHQITEGMRSFDLPPLPGLVEGELGPLAAGDWLALITPMMKDLSATSAQWWDSVMEESTRAYELWLQSEPLARLHLRPVLPAGSDRQPWARLEQRAQTVLLRALPESMRSEAISSRSTATVDILFPDIEEVSARGTGREDTCPEAAGGG